MPKIIALRFILDAVRDSTTLLAIILLQQFTGINIVMLLSGRDEWDDKKLTLILIASIGGVNFLSTAVAVFLVDRISCY